MSTNAPVLTAALLADPTRGRDRGDRVRCPAPGSHDDGAPGAVRATYESLQADGDRRAMIRLSLQLVPFAGIAFLWFIGVIREQLGDVEDRLFSTVFMGSGLLFLALLFTGAAISSSMVEMLEGPAANATCGPTAETPHRV